MNNLLYILYFIIGFFVLMQLYMRISTKLKKGKSVEGLERFIGRGPKANARHMFYFYTSSCAACKPMGPIVDRLKKDYKNIHKVNLGTDMEIGRRFGVMGTPSFVVIENQKIDGFYVGAKSEQFLIKQLAG